VHLIVATAFKRKSVMVNVDFVIPGPILTNRNSDDNANPLLSTVPPMKLPERPGDREESLQTKPLFLETLEINLGDEMNIEEINVTVAHRPTVKRVNPLNTCLSQLRTASSTALGKCSRSATDRDQ
jgi:hypothetical protein